jgi:hypothetical protein
MKNEKALPKNPDALPGAVVPQYRTYKGRRLGPYWFRVWRSRGRIFKVYVPREQLEQVRSACAARRRERREIVELLARNRARMAEIKAAVRAFRREYLPQGLWR